MLAKRTFECTFQGQRLLVSIVFKENQQFTKKIKDITTGKETKWTTTRIFAKEGVELTNYLKKLKRRCWNE